jgi:hypothetical protein
MKRYCTVKVPKSKRKSQGKDSQERGKRTLKDPQLNFCCGIWKGRKEGTNLIHKAIAIYEAIFSVTCIM